MTRLLGVELSRLLARRLVLVVALALFGGMVVLNGIRLARAESRVREVPCDYVVAEIGPPGSHPGVAPGEPARPTQPEQPTCRSDRRVHMTSARDEAMAAGIAVALAGFLVGTSFAGAEWAAGTMQALLFWEPRRGRVMAAKAGALAVVMFLASLAAQLLQIGLTAVGAWFRGTFAGVPPDFYEQLVLRGARVGLLAVFTSLLAFGIAGLTRNTAAALGVGFVYFAVLENLVRGFRPRWSPYLVSSQFQAWIEGKETFFFEPRLREGVFRPDVFVLRTGRAGLTLAVYLAVVVGAATVLFVRRDVS